MIKLFGLVVFMQVATFDDLAKYSSAWARFENAKAAILTLASDHAHCTGKKRLPRNLAIEHRANDLMFGPFFLRNIADWPLVEANAAAAERQAFQYWIAVSECESK